MTALPLGRKYLKLFSHLSWGASSVTLFCAFLFLFLVFIFSPLGDTIKAHTKFLVGDSNSLAVATIIIACLINCMLVTISEQPLSSVDTKYITIMFHVVSLSLSGLTYKYIPVS